MATEINALAPVSEMMRAAGLEPKKALGQHFLFDLNLTGKIARAVPDLCDTTIVEVGPGPGGLTRALLAAGAGRVVAIEKDRAAKPILDQIVAASAGRLEVIYGDALDIFGDAQIWRDRVPGAFAICANLPYNAGTPLLIRWLHMMPRPVVSMTLMFQKEVAERIVARPGTPAYGRLSVLTALAADAKMLFTVPRTAFAPPPKVTSAIVRISPRAHHLSPDDLARVEKLTARLFNQRRKMIRSIVQGVDWAQFGLTGTERAEELAPEKFLELAGKIETD
jgi:16S rRNA (adenine1518-N6/adenine1519-N6)-dimethyltransferase